VKKENERMKTVDITYNQARAARSAIASFSSVKLKKGISLKFVMALKRAADILSPECERVDEVLGEAADKYLERDADGNAIPVEGGGMKLRKESIPEYIQTVEDALGAVFSFTAPIDHELIETFLDSIGDTEEVLSVGQLMDILPIVIQED